MFGIKQSAGLLMLAGLVSLAGSTAKASGIETFTFTGICGDCSGTGTGLLTVSDTYTPGDALTIDEFISFVYYPTDLLPAGMTLTSGSVTAVTGGLPAGLSGYSNLDISAGSGGQFTTFSGGTWDVCPTGCGDYGETYSWTAGSGTPEPGTYALTGIAFVAFRAGRRYLRRISKRG